VEGAVANSGSSSGSSARVPSRPITIAASVGALYSADAIAEAAADAADTANDELDYNGDDEKYRRLKMKYLTSLKVVRPIGPSSERPVTVSQSVPDKFHPNSLRSQPIDIPEKTRRVDDFMYKSPADDTMDQADDYCQFVLEF